MKISLQLGNFSFSAERGAAPAAEAKSLSPDLAAWTKGDDLDSVGKGATLVSPYSQSSWVYIAVSCLAENIAQIPLRISRIPASAAKQLARGASASFKKRVLGENIIESGAVVDLFNNPHPTMDRALFWANVVSWKALRGEFFVVPLDNMDSPVDMESRGGRITKMLALEPAMFWHVVQGYELQAWRYTGSPMMSPLPSEMLLPSEVIHHRTFNPYLYWRGLSPLLLALLAAMSDYAASQFMKGLMMNNADTGVIATTEQNLTQEQREQFMAALRERKRKAGTPDRPLFLSSGVTIAKPTISNVDMEFLSNRKFNREEIFAILKVPPSMAGIESQGASKGGQGSTSGGSQAEDRRIFIENTVTNICRQIEAAFGPVAKRFDPSLEIWFDIDSLPIMQEARRDRLDAAGKAFGLGAPFNDINRIYDLGFPDYAWGNKGYLPFNLQEAGEQPKQPTPGNDPNDPENPEEDSATPFERAAKLFSNFLKPRQLPAPPRPCAAPNGYEQSIAGSERMKAGRMQKFFFEQRNRVLGRLDKLKSLSRAIVQKDIDDLWHQEEENKKLHEKIDQLLKSDLEFGGEQLMEEIGAGVDFNLPPAEAIAFLEKRKKIIDAINETTWNDLKASLQEGLAEGESTAQLAQRIKDVYTGASDARAWTIAMTETNVAVNSGRNLAMKQAGVKRKGWLTAHLETTRATHYANERLSQNEGGIPIDQIWPNGCAYPGDPAGAAGETINCHCVGFAVAPDGKMIIPTKFLHFEEFITRKGAKK